MFENMFENSKKLDNALGPNSKKWLLKHFGTNLGPKCVELIFNAPNVANLGFGNILPKLSF